MNGQWKRAPLTTVWVEGGGCNDSGSSVPASNRGSINPVGSSSDLRFPFSFVFVMLNAKAAVYVEVTQTSEKALSLNIEKKHITKNMQVINNDLHIFLFNFLQKSFKNY